MFGNWFRIFKVLMNIFLVKSESRGHVGLEDLCDGVDVGRCPDVEAKIHPDGHMVTI